MSAQRAASSCLLFMSAPPPDDAPLLRRHACALPKDASLFTAADAFCAPVPLLHHDAQSAAKRCHYFICRCPPTRHADAAMPALLMLDRYFSPLRAAIAAARQKARRAERRKDVKKGNKRGSRC